MKKREYKQTINLYAQLKKIVQEVMKFSYKSENICIDRDEQTNSLQIRFNCLEAETIKTINDIIKEHGFNTETWKCNVVINKEYLTMPYSAISNQYSTPEIETAYFNITMLMVEAQK